MTSYDQMVRDFMQNVQVSDMCHSPTGRTYITDNDEYSGYYWYYESSSFIIDIHNFMVKEDLFSSETDWKHMFEYAVMMATYMVSVSGEWIRPYQTIEPNSMIIGSAEIPYQDYVIHKNSKLLSIGIKYKKSFFEQDALARLALNEDKMMHVFLAVQDTIAQRICKIAQEIFACKMTGSAAELFFEAKASEWLSIALEAYQQCINEKVLSKEDDIAVTTVARYIDDHYALDISQPFLQKLSAMSATKLKTSFKNKYKMSITEYTQRKRINMAEHLLLSSTMPIGDIAQMVGYQSFSRFSILYKRYKGISPKDIKKFIL